MAITKPLHELSLDEINEELEFAGSDKQYKRIDSARNAIKKMVELGSIPYAGTGKFVDVNKLEKLDEKKENKTPKKKEKVSKKFITIDDPNVDRIIFCRFGKKRIIAVGYYEGDEEKLKAKLENDKIVALSSCRNTAVDPNYRGKYTVDNEIRTSSGKPSIGVEDDITDFLKGATIAVLSNVCEENGLDFDRWQNLNPGMQRMCIGNALRGKLRHGHRVSISGNVISEGGLSESEEEDVA